MDTPESNEQHNNSIIRVMVVDDSKLSRMSLKTTISKASNQVTLVAEAEDGVQALEMMALHRPQVVLMDIGMPIMDGIRATWKIKELYPETLVIMLTSHDSKQDVMEAFQAGAHSYCLKETPPAMLIHVILSTAHGACWIDPQIARMVMSHIAPNSGPKEFAAARENHELQYPVLTEREREVLKLITEGKNNTEISDALSISLNTVKTHLKNIFQKLEVEDRTGAALKALKERII